MTTHTDLIYLWRDVENSDLVKRTADALADLEQQVAALRVDAERYRWLRTRIIAADFDYDNSGEAAIVFSWPDKCSVSANIDASIDAAMGEKADAIRGLA